MCLSSMPLITIAVADTAAKQATIKGGNMFRKLKKRIIDNLYPRFIFNERGTWVAAAIVASAAIGTGTAMYQGHQARKSAKSAQEAQMSQWQDMSEPQKEYMRQRYPMELEMLKSYVPYYKKQVGANEGMLGYPKEMMESYMPLYKDIVGTQRETLPITSGMYQQYAPYYQEAVSEARKLLPYSGKMMEKYHYPMMGKTYEDILNYQEPETQPWEKRAVSIPFAQAKEKLGERTAGRGTMRAGAPQKLAALTDIAEAEALARLPFEREEREKQKRIELMMRYLGFQPGGGGVPGLPGVPGVGAPTMAGVGAPQGMGVSIPAMPGQPATPAGQSMDMGSMGQLMGMMQTKTPAPVATTVPMGTAVSTVPASAFQVNAYPGSSAIPIMP